MNTRHRWPIELSSSTFAVRIVTIAAAVVGGMVMLGVAVAKETDRVKHQADADAKREHRIARLLADLTMEEKIQLLAGAEMDTKPNARLGIPAFAMADGPHGVRHGQATCFPTSIAMGASWDEALIERVGVALAREMLAKGRNVLLGPCINPNVA